MHALSITHLAKTYANGTQALKDISFTVEEGDFFALLGPNGAGKSTTIGIVTSLINKTSGGIKVFDYDIDHQGAEAKACIGVVPQEFNFNIFEKVFDILIFQAGFYGISKKVAYQRAEKYLKKLGIWDKRNQQARMLSGGMKRRLMIARALLHEPKLLILDEPTAGVDIELRRSLWDFLREINAEGTTVILTTHYLEEAENLCKNMAIIDQGKLIEYGNMRQILKKLHVETFIFYLAEPLQNVPELPGFPTRLQDETTLEVDLSEGKSLSELFALLNSHHIRVNSMRNKANRLEELFLRLTSTGKVS